MEPLDGRPRVKKLTKKRQSKNVGKKNAIREKALDTKALYSQELVETSSDDWTKFIWKLNAVTTDELTYSERANNVNEELLKREERERDRSALTGSQKSSDEALDDDKKSPEMEERFHHSCAHGHFVKGNEFLAEKNWQKACDSLTRAIEHDCTDVRFFVNRSYVFEKMGKTDLALTDASRAVSIDDQEPRAHYRLGRMYKLKRNFVQADASFKRCLSFGYTHDVWSEMMDCRTSLLKTVHGEALVEEHRPHLICDSLAEAMNFLLREKVMKTSHRGSPSLPTTNTTASRDTSNKGPYEPDTEAMAKALEQYAPSNIFNSKGIVIWNDLRTRPSDVRRMRRNSDAGGGSGLKARIQKIFQRFGEVTEMRVMQGYVWVMYDSSDVPVKAIAELQGELFEELSKAPLLLRFAPVRMTYQAMKEHCSFTGHCRGWRTTGCSYPNCRFEHRLPDATIDLTPRDIIAHKNNAHLRRHHDRKFRN